jgi:hypothetical protein
VTVKVIRDTSDNGREQEMKVIVESMDDSDADHKEVYKEEEVIRMKMQGDCKDHPESMIIIKDGDTMKVCDKHYRFVYPGEGETFNWDAMPPIPEMPEMPELHEFYYDFEAPDSVGLGVYYFNFNNDSIDTAFFFHHAVPFEFGLDDVAVQQAMKEYQKAMKEYEYQFRDFDGQEREMKEQQREMERQMREGQVFVYPPVEPVPPMVWNYGAPELPDKSTEKVIRQELREDGLVDPGKDYIIEISPKEMYINGVKQDKETSKKYRHLVEGLEPGLLDDNGNFKIVF